MSQSRSAKYRKRDARRSSDLKWRLARDVRLKKRKSAITDFLKAIKLDRGCAVCGYKRCVSALEWHHTGDDKDFELSKIRKGGWDAVHREIDKCVVLCANCHREAHVGMNGITIPSGQTEIQFPTNNTQFELF